MPRDAQQAAVNEVLKEIGADAIPQIVVMNKIDATWEKGAAAGLREGVETDEYGRISRVFVSARTGDGLDALREALAGFARARSASRGTLAADSPSLHGH